MDETVTKIIIEEIEDINMLKEQVKLRRLCLEDAPNMLEWMLDSEINQYFRFKIEEVNMESVHAFILNANQEIDKGMSANLAVSDRKNNYMGTISLKNINTDVKSAEYAISLRKAAQGMGIAEEATKQILKIAFVQMNLNRVYLNVTSGNQKAIKLYEKCGFLYEGEFRKHIFIKREIQSLTWYGMLKEDYFKLR